MPYPVGAGRSRPARHLSRAPHRRALLLCLVVLAGSSGYYTLGEGRWSVEEVCYFTIITLSTVGFREMLVIAVKYPGSPARYDYNPGPDLVLEERTTLIVLAETLEMNRLRLGVTSGAIGRYARPF